MGAGGTPANEVVATIGSGKDHADILTWEAATDEDCTAGWGAGIYASPCSPVGQIEEDADFTDAVTFSGATTDGTHYRRLTVAEAYRHSGDFPKVDVGAKNTAYVLVAEDYFEMEWLLVEAGGSMSNFASINQTGGQDALYRNVICDVSTSGYQAFRLEPGSGKNPVVENCIGITRRSHASTEAFYSNYLNGCKWRNCTGLGLGASNDEIYTYGEPTNCIGIGGGATAVYKNSEGAGDYNIGSDTTAPGANSVDNVAAADLFADTTAGAEDLHLKADDTAASGLGADLSAYFTDDIDGDARSDWDCGSDEFISAGTTVTPSPASASWAVAAPTLKKTITPTPASATWSTVSPGLAKRLSPAPPSATWSVVVPSTGAVIVTPAAVAASWSAVEPTLKKRIAPDAIIVSWSAVTPAAPALFEDTPLFDAMQALRVLLADSSTFRTLVGETTRVKAMTHIYLEGLPEPASGDTHTAAELAAYRPCAVIYSDEAGGWTKDYESAGDHHQLGDGGELHLVLMQTCPVGLDAAPDSDANRQFKNTLGQIVDDLCDLTGNGSSADRLVFDSVRLAEGPWWNHPDKEPTAGIEQGADLLVAW